MPGLLRSYHRTSRRAMSNPRPTPDEVTAALRESLRTLEAKYPGVIIHIRSVDIEFEDREAT